MLVYKKNNLFDQIVIVVTIWIHTNWKIVHLKWLSRVLTNFFFGKISKTRLNGDLFKLQELFENFSLKYIISLWFSSINIFIQYFLNHNNWVIEIPVFNCTGNHWLVLIDCRYLSQTDNICVELILIILSCSEIG